jgi:hypothetical protein
MPRRSAQMLAMTCSTGVRKGGAGAPAEAGGRGCRRSSNAGVQRDSRHPPSDDRRADSRYQRPDRCRSPSPAGARSCRIREDSAAVAHGAVCFCTHRCDADDDER